MKLIIILLLLSVQGMCQDHACDSGYKWMPSMATSSLRIEGNKCVPDSAYDRMWLMFAENMCYETGLYMSTGDLTYSRSNKWDSVNKKCITVVSCRKKVNDKWIDITEEQFRNISNRDQEKKKVIQYKRD